MIRFTILEYAWKTLARRRVRTAVTVLGYAIAVVVVCVAMSVAGPRMKKQSGLLLSVGTHLVGFIPDPLYGAGKRAGLVAQGAYTAVMRAENLARIVKIPGVKAAAPYLLYQEQDPLSGTTVSIGGLALDNISTQINAFSANDVIAGRYLRPDDAWGVVVEESYAVAERLHPGDTLSRFGRNFQIVGIAATNIRAARANIYAPINAVRDIVMESQCVTLAKDDFNIILVEATDARLVEDVRRSLEKVMANSSIVGFNCFVPARTAAEQTETGGRIVAAVIAIAVVLFSARSQWASVAERRREIGILKAQGWPSGWVRRQIMVESVLQALAGGLLGGAMSLLVVLSLGFGDRPAPISFALAACIAILLAIVGGMLAGLISAAAASRLDPAQALRRP